MANYTLDYSGAQVSAKLDQLDEMSGIAVQDTAPTQNIKMWLDTSGNPLTLPEIDDVHINNVDTWSSQKISTMVCRPNLLDNWYFGNPVNQRGQSSYNNSGYAIDRWAFSSADASATKQITIQSDCCYIDITDTAQYQGSGYSQLLNDTLAGKEVTLSVFVSEITGTLILEARTATWGDHGQLAISTPGVHSLTVSVQSNELSNFRFCLFSETIQNLKVKIKAVKLELGNSQTLAHLEGSTWVLNEIPNYDEQIFRCKSSTADSNDIYANNPPVYSDEIGIVVNGNITNHVGGASIGQYVILKNSTITGKADGLYTAAKVIPANTAIDGTYLSGDSQGNPISGGGLNDLVSMQDVIRINEPFEIVNSSVVSDLDNNDCFLLISGHTVYYSIRFNMAADTTGSVKAMAFKQQYDKYKPINYAVFNGVIGTAHETWSNATSGMLYFNATWDIGLSGGFKNGKGYIASGTYFI